MYYCFLACIFFLFYFFYNLLIFLAFLFFHFIIVVYLLLSFITFFILYYLKNVSLMLGFCLFLSPVVPSWLFLFLCSFILSCTLPFFHFCSLSSFLCSFSYCCCFACICFFISFLSHSFFLVFSLFFFFHFHSYSFFTFSLFFLSLSSHPFHTSSIISSQPPLNEVDMSVYSCHFCGCRQETGRYIGWSLWFMWVIRAVVLTVTPSGRLLPLWSHLGYHFCSVWPLDLWQMELMRWELGLH